MTEPQNLALQYALGYQARGWLVVPDYNVDADGLCTCYLRAACPHPGKHPRLDNGVNGASGESDRIHYWFERVWPNRCNVGIATGRRSGLIVVDVDPRNGGNETIAKLEAQYGPLPRLCPRARTGSGGEHIYLEHPADGAEIRSQKLPPGVDILSGGMHAVAPPSVSSKGSYTWLPDRGPDAPLAPIPEAWLNLLRPRSRPSAAPSDRQAGAHGDASLPVGQSTRDFLKHGAPAGEQRARALVATRSLLASGRSASEIVDLIWQALQRSPVGDPRRPWTLRQVQALVTDLESTPAPPLQDLVDDMPRVRITRRALARALDLDARPRPRTVDIRSFH